MTPLKKTYTPNVAHQKAEHYCAYQERCQQEVRDKLYEWGLHHSDVENIIAQLISDNFINEERFALSYARGKFNLMHWGKVKIKIHLKHKKIGERILKKALAQINDEEYETKINYLIEKKENLLREKNPILKKKKLFAYLSQKGYESDVINFSLKIRQL